MTAPQEQVVDPVVTGKRARKQPVVANTETGISVIQEQARLLTGSPGVYRMLDVNGDVLYVGKAQNLKKRVSSYASPSKLSHRIFRMVSETRSMEVIATHSEVEALLLESNLIKRLKPRYNVLLRDDKSFPHILITEDHASPRIVKHRGAQNVKGSYYGPFASAGAVNRTVAALQRAFLIRNCSDSIFAARTRPCLQFQIKRCAAPCVDHPDAANYGELVTQAKAFLSGRSSEVRQQMADAMQSASDALDFETAALYRDRIRALAAIQAHQDINVEGVADADIIALHREGGASCVQVFFFRGGGNYGNRAYFPSHDKSLEDGELMAAFIGQFYDNKVPPPLVLTNHATAERELIEEALSVKAERRVHVSRPQRGAKRKLVDHAELNAREALGRRVAESASQRRLLDGVAEAFAMEAPPERIEVYDNSHVQGSHPVGAMIVAGPEGFQKGNYRRFNIRGVRDKSSEKEPADDKVGTITGGDDFAMMRQVLTRRFERALREDADRTGGTWPDLILIDGGAGQLGIAREVLDELGIDDVLAVGVAKGPDRDAGRERFFVSDRPPFMMERESPVLYFLQRLRDEAHRFAIEGHRARRAKAITRNVLDDVPGIGAKRKKALLHHFGSGRAVSRAGLSDLESVDGISKTVAKRIYDFFHADG